MNLGPDAYPQEWTPYDVWQHEIWQAFPHLSAWLGSDVLLDIEVLAQVWEEGPLDPSDPRLSQAEQAEFDAWVDDQEPCDCGTVLGESGMYLTHAVQRHPDCTGEMSMTDADFFASQPVPDVGF